MKANNSSANSAYLSIVLILLILVACRDRVTPPDVDDTPKPGKRDYTWTIDTLAYPGSMQTLMRDIWASSSTNVYVVGHNDQPGPGTMFRYDGTSWKTTRFHVADGGTVSGAVSLSSIYGFGPNDIYAVGERIYDNPNPPPNFLDSSLIIHYDGSDWREVPISRGQMLLTIFGTSPNNIWAGGVNGTLYQYDGNIWNRHIAPRSYSRGSYQFLSISGSLSGETYSVSAWNNVAQVGGIDSTYYFLNRYKNGAWTVSDSFLIAASQVFFPFGLQLWTSPEKIFYSAGPNIYRQIRSEWIEMLATGKWMTKVRGTSELNIFSVGHFGTVYHWNGSDWFQFTEFLLDDVHYSSVWTDGKEVFIVGFTTGGYKTIIAHGK